MTINNRTTLILKFFLLLCAVFLAGNAFAQGRVLIKPHIETGWQWDDNFHKSETNTKSVSTYYIKPGVEFGYTTDKTTITLDYWLNYLKYDDQDDIQAGETPADDFDYTEHQANFLAQSQVSDRVLIGLDNLYWKTRDPANADANSNAVDRFKYNLNQLSPWLQYRFAEKFGAGLRYTNKILDYQDDEPGEGEDSDEHRGTLTFYYYFNQRTFFDLDYQYWTRDYDKTSTDYDSHQVMVNMNRQFNYFTFSAGVGFHARDFDGTVTGGDQEKFAWKLSLLGQNPQDAAIPKSSVYLAFSSNLNDIGSGDSYHEATRLDAVLTYLLLEKLNCTLTAWFLNSDYETSDRDDDRYFISGAVDYLIHEFFTIGLEAGYEERDSNTAGKDFDNTFVMLNVKFNYDMGSR